MIALFSLTACLRRYVLILVSSFVLGSGLVTGINAQGSAANYLGNGGIHSIIGRIYIGNGRRSDIVGIKIRLFNVASNELSIIPAATGAFTFKNLLPGSYTVQIDGGEPFEDVNERTTGPSNG